MLDILEVDLPDVYICPDQQYNKTALRANGYMTRNMLLSGDTKLRNRTMTFSWGAVMNKTFDEVIDDILPDILHIFIILGRSRSRKLKKSF